MRSAALLDLLGRLLAGHDARVTGGATVGGVAVVPVVLVGEFDEIDEADPPLQRLLAACARYADAAFADAAAVASAPPRPFVADGVLRGALTAALTIERPNGTQPLLFAGDNRDILLGTTDVSIASDGERELIGLARSLLDDRWEHHQLGMLTYSERGMDRPAIRASWAAVTAALQVPAVRLGTLRTLLVLAESPRLLPDVHTAADPSARFVLDGDRLVPRSGSARVRQVASDLARHQGTVVLYLGAGFSLSSRLPLGNDLRDDALRRRYEATRDAAIAPLAVDLYRDAQHDGALTAREEALGEEHFAAGLTLEQVVRIESTIYSGVSEALDDFADRHGRATPGAAVRELAAILGRRPGLVLVTVNFDELLEQAAGDGVRRFALDSEMGGFRGYLQRYIDGHETATPLLKLHGTISVRESCVVNAEQTEQGLPAAKRDALRSVAEIPGGPHPWIYVGASLRDVDVAPVLDSDLFRNGTEETWVAPLRDRSVERFTEASRSVTWRSAGRAALDERSISASADQFIERLVAEIRSVTAG